METIDSGRPLGLIDAARLGHPLIDRFGASWWLVSGPNPNWFRTGTSQAAARRNPVGALRYHELKDMCGPLRAGQIEP